MPTRPPTKTPARSGWLDRNRRNATWLTGFGGVVIVTAIWALTGRLSPELVALFGTMMGVGEGIGALREYLSGERDR